MEALSSQLESLWPMTRDDPVEASQGEPGGDNEAGLRIRLSDNPKAVAEARGLKLARQIEHASSQSDVDALVRAAEHVQQRPAASLALDERTSFTEELGTIPENLQSGFSRLRGTARQAGDAAAMWEAATDHLRAAVHAARRIQLPPEAITRLLEAESRSEATALRLRIKEDVLRGMHPVRMLEQEESPRPKLIDEAIRHLAAALQRHRTYADKFAPGVPHVEGFDLAARDAISDAQKLSHIAPAQSLAATLAESLHRVATDLRAELQNGIAQAPTRRLFASVVPLLRHAVALGNEAAAKQAQAAKPALAGLAQEVAAWHEAMKVFGACSATYDKHAATLPADAAPEPVVAQLHDRIKRGTSRTVDGLTQSLSRAEESFTAGLAEHTIRLLRFADDTQETSASLALMARQCHDIHARLSHSPELFAAAALSHEQLHRFAALEATCRALGSPTPDANTVLQRAEEMAGIARSLGKKPRGTTDRRVGPTQAARTDEMRALVSTIHAKTMELAVELECTAVSNFQLDKSEESSAALGRAAVLCAKLPSLLPEDPMPGFGPGFSVTSGPTDDSASDAQKAAGQRETAAQARGLIERGLKLPPGTPESVVARHESSMLVAQQMELCAAASAEVIASSIGAAQALRTANPAEGAKLLKQHVESLRKLGTLTGEALNDQLAVGGRRGIVSQISNVTGMFLREIEKVSDATRRALEGLGVAMDLRRNVENLAHRLNAEGAGYAAVVHAQKKVRQQYAFMAGRLSDVMGSVGSTGVPEIAAVIANQLVQRSIVDGEITQAKTWLGWLQTKLDSTPSGALNAKELAELKGAAESADAAMKKTGEELGQKLPTNTELQRKLLQVVLGIRRGLLDVKAEIDARAKPASTTQPEAAPSASSGKPKKKGGLKRR